MSFFRPNYINFIAFSLLLHGLIMGMVFRHSHQNIESKVIHVSLGSTPVAKALTSVVESHLTIPKTKKYEKKLATPQKKMVQIPTQDQETPVENDGAVNPHQGSPTQIKSVISEYGKKISELIHQHKKYPRMAYSLNQEGKVLISLKLRKDGKIIDLKLIENSPYKSLANASIETIRSIEKFPPIPEELEMSEISFKIPIEYKIEM